MSPGFAKALLVGCGLVVSLAANAAAAAAAEEEESPTIITTPFLDTPETLTASLLELEARVASAIEAVAPGRIRGTLAADSGNRTGYEADEIRDLAASRQATYVLVGEWLTWRSSESRHPNPEIALSLRSGHSGATEFRYRLNWGSAAPAPAPATVAAEVERLARAILHDLRLLPVEASTAAVAAAKETSPPPPAGDQGRRSDFLKISRDQPIEIDSDELEVVAIGSARQFTFTDHVHVVQGDMELFAGYLEALYPDGASQPERLDARSNVRMIEGDLEVHCQEVTYLREDGLVICRGDALLLQGCDEVRGKEIEFYLDEERVKVLGAASVVLRFESEDRPGCERGGTSG